MKSGNPIHLALLTAVAIVLGWSGWKPYDRFTWWLEVAPGLAGIAILVATYHRFRFTTICYVLIALHICVLCVGGHYTYARVPSFDWLRAVFGWQRNDFDRLGHLMQGFVPAIIARELLIRLQIVNRTRWIPFLVICICLAISASYELIEWVTALTTGNAANDFLGSQGDIWDTQADMACALVGAICALLFLSEFHNRALQQINFEKEPSR